MDIEGYLATDKDFRGSLSKIKNKKPDALFVAGLAPQLGVLFKQIKELGIVVNLLSQGAAENKQMLDGAAGAAEGLVYTVIILIHLVNIRQVFLISIFLVMVKYRANM